MDQTNKEPHYCEQQNLLNHNNFYTWRWPLRPQHELSNKGTRRNNSDRRCTHTAQTLLSHTVACRLKAWISESERTSVARQRLRQLNAYVIDRSCRNESNNNGVCAVTKPLAAAVSKWRKLKRSRRCPLSSRQRTLLRGRRIWNN
jgi:hypothetical protein